MKKKILSGFFVSLFFLITSHFFGSDFSNFHTKEKLTQGIEKQIQTEIKDFSFSQIQEIPEIYFFTTPGKQYINKLTDLITSSKKRVYLNIYMLTEKRIRQSLIDAHKRGVDIRIILEKNVYKTPNINRETFDILTSAGIKIVWSSSDIYDLDHAKYMLVDDYWMISTGNFTYSTFTKNRDFFVFGKDSNILSVLEQSFLGDFLGKPNIVYAPNMIMSPQYARQKIEFVIKNAQKSLDIYMPYIDDASLQKLLKDALGKGVKVRIITGQFDTEDSFFSEMTHLGAKIVFSKKVIHAKVILTDNEILTISSANYSSASLDTNKEMGVILRGEKLVKQYKNIFESDL